jgi:acyl carrier protein
MTDSIDEGSHRERIRAVIRDVVGNCPDSDDANLRDHGVDSFTLIELATALEEKFSITIPDELLQWCTMYYSCCFPACDRAAAQRGA